jgi:hypothetical protein
MMHYKFRRFGTLMQYRGMPIYFNGRRIGPEPQIVWWWPVNWVVLPFAFILMVWRMIKEAL